MTEMAGNAGRVIRVVLLACGSFNPITNMHLRLFELARDFLHSTGRYRVIGGIISPVSDRYSRKNLASADHRCSMIRLALQSTDWIRLDTWESEQKDWSETLRVLRHHAEHAGSTFTDTVNATPSKKRKVEVENRNIATTEDADQSSTADSAISDPIQIKLLCGSDILESFTIPGLWKDEDVREIVQRFGMVVVTRTGSDPEQFIYESDILTENRSNIAVVREWIQNEISSTKIRTAVRRGHSVKYLVQDSVIDYISKHKLYRLTNANLAPVNLDNKYRESKTPTNIRSISCANDDLTNVVTKGCATGISGRSRGQSVPPARGGGGTSRSAGLRGGSSRLGRSQSVDNTSTRSAGSGWWQPDAVLSPGAELSAQQQQQLMMQRQQHVYRRHRGINLDEEMRKHQSTKVVSGGSSHGGGGGGGAGAGKHSRDDGVDGTAPERHSMREFRFDDSSDSERGGRSGGRRHLHHQHPTSRGTAARVASHSQPQAGNGGAAVGERGMGRTTPWNSGTRRQESIDSNRSNVMYQHPPLGNTVLSPMLERNQNNISLLTSYDTKESVDMRFDGRQPRSSIGAVASPLSPGNMNTTAIAAAATVTAEGARNRSMAYLPPGYRRMTPETCV